MYKVIPVENAKAERRQLPDSCSDSMTTESMKTHAGSIFQYHKMDDTFLSPDIKIRRRRSNPCNINTRALSVTLIAQPDYCTMHSIKCPVAFDQAVLVNSNHMETIRSLTGQINHAHDIRKYDTSRNYEEDMSKHDA